jgi:cytochrome c peroxidase
VHDPRARDRGHINTTDRLEDAYRFRTPSLRNVAETAPYGHNGTYADLEGIIRHHLDPLKALDRYDRQQVVLVDDSSLSPVDFILWQDKREMKELRRSIDIEPRDLEEQEIELLVRFLESLSDPVSLDHRLGIPDQVPSGLPVDLPVKEDVEPIAAQHKNGEEYE